MDSLFSTDQKECEEIFLEYCDNFLNLDFVNFHYMSYEYIKQYVEECFRTYNRNNPERPLDTQYFDIDNVIKVLHNKQTMCFIENTIKKEDKCTVNPVIK